MNWKPKKGVGKTLYAIDIRNYDFNSTTLSSAWTSDMYCPKIVKYTDVMIITNGATKESAFIVAKKECDSVTKKKGDVEYKTYKLKKINSINEDKQGVVLMIGQDIVISNDKKELLNIFRRLYGTKEIAARKAIDDYNDSVLIRHYFNPERIKRRLMAQPKHVMASYKNFVEKLKKI